MNRETDYRHNRNSYSFVNLALVFTLLNPCLPTGRLPEGRTLIQVLWLLIPIAIGTFRGFGGWKRRIGSYMQRVNMDNNERLKDFSTAKDQRYSTSFGLSPAMHIC